MTTSKKDQINYQKVGRHTKYTVELGQEICDAIASSELGLIHLINKNPHWPGRANIFQWLRLHPEFRDRYYKAKEDQVEVCVEYMQEILNEPHRVVDQHGIEKVDVPLLKLKIDSMKWHVGKLKPKKYGDDYKNHDLENRAIEEDCKKRYEELDEKNKKEY